MSGWVPVWCLSSQTIVWALIIPRIASRRTVAILTFTELPEDPTW